MERASNSSSLRDELTCGKGPSGRPTRCTDRLLPGGARNGSGWQQRRRQASLRGGSAGDVRGLAEERRAGGCSRKSPTEAPGTGNGGRERRRPLRSAQPLRRWLRMRSARSSAPRALRPPSAAPAGPAAAGPAAAAGEAWRPGPDASPSVASPLRQPPTTKTFLRPAEPKTNRVRRVPRPARPRASPGLALPGPRGRNGRQRGCALSLTFSAAAAIVTGNLPGVAPRRCRGGAGVGGEGRRRREEPSSAGPDQREGAAPAASLRAGGCAGAGARPAQARGAR